MTKKIGAAVLGSTGSIGESAFQVLSRFADRFDIVALAARSNVRRLAEQAVSLKAKVAVTTDEARLPELKTLLPESIKCAGGEQSMTDAAVHPDVDVVLCAVVGTGGLLPVLAAIRAGKTIALASKEVLVMAGELVRRELALNPQARLIPVDSEHSAIFQCLQGRRPDEVRRLILTASGGAFRDLPASELGKVTWQDAMKHPTWSMGPKITIDSASLMNKALELVEAGYLFDVSPDKLEVILHPQSIVHSMIELADGSVIAQAAMPDMRFAIQYALSWPDRWDGGLPPMDRKKLHTLTFMEPDRKKYPSLDMAFYAMTQGGTMPTVMNAANETAVEKFRKGDIDFTAIWSIVEKTMKAHKVRKQENLDVILEADRWARDYAAGLES